MTFYWMKILYCSWYESCSERSRISLRGMMQIRYRPNLGIFSLHFSMLSRPQTLYCSSFSRISLLFPTITWCVITCQRLLFLEWVTTCFQQMKRKGNQNLETREDAYALYPHSSHFGAFHSCLQNYLTSFRFFSGSHKKTDGFLNSDILQEPFHPSYWLFPANSMAGHFVSWFTCWLVFWNELFETNKISL